MHCPAAWQSTSTAPLNAHAFLIAQVLPPGETTDEEWSSSDEEDLEYDPNGRDPALSSSEGNDASSESDDDDSAGDSDDDAQQDDAKRCVCPAVAAAVPPAPVSPGGHTGVPPALDPAKHKHIEQPHVWQNLPTPFFFWYHTRQHVAFM